MTRGWHLLRLLVHLLAGLATASLVFPLVNGARRDKLVRRWSLKLLRICGVQVRTRVPPGVNDTAPALIVANHISWLDIFVINARQPCRFVAKADIRDWPLVGFLCERAGTIFIARGRQRDVRRIYQGVVASVRAGERVAFFPEGTTAPQGCVLPFHANLFEAAIEAGVPVHPYAVRYVDQDGELHPAADFVGDTSFAQSVMTILAVRDLVAEVTLLPAISTADTNRRALADAARAAIAGALAATPVA